MNRTEARHFGNTLIKTIQLLAENVKNKFNSTNMKHNLLRPFTENTGYRAGTHPRHNGDI